MGWTRYLFTKVYWLHGRAYCKQVGSKKGDKSNPSNYRPIAITRTAIETVAYKYERKSQIIRTEVSEIYNQELVD